jgi:hypothetical protein
MIFLLQYEEKCLDYTAAEVSAGTMTKTAVKAEPMDPDPGCQGYKAIRTAEILLGTQSHTFVKAEAPDADPSAPQLGALPRSAQLNLGTCTATNVNAEEIDADPDLDRERYNAIR